MASTTAERRLMITIAIVTTVDGNGNRETLVRRGRRLTGTMHYTTKERHGDSEGWRRQHGSTPEVEVHGRQGTVVAGRGVPSLGRSHALCCEGDTGGIPYGSEEEHPTGGGQMILLLLL